jgi:bud emergence protein 1
MFIPKEKVKPPRSLRTARLSVVKNQISTPVIQTSPTNNSPKKVIKALYDYQAQSPNELSFTRGDFFLVGNTDSNDFYEAFNPITNSRGIVPVQYFQALEKHERAMVDSTARDVGAGARKQQDPMLDHHNEGKALNLLVFFFFFWKKAKKLTFLN